MRKLCLAVVATSLALSGCIIHRSHPRGYYSTRRGCPPAHHWDGYACVHNGKAKGHDR